MLSTVLADVAEPVGRKLVETAIAVTGGRLQGDAVREQLELPGRYGGMAMRLIAEGRVADATFWAAWSTMRKAVPDLAQRLGLGPVACAGQEEAAAARDRLLEAGVQVDELGGVSFTEQAAAEYAAGPWAKDVPADLLGKVPQWLDVRPTQPAPPLGSEPSRVPMRVASRVYKHLEALRAHRLWSKLPAWRQEALLSAGGPGGGSLWTQMPVDERGFFPTSHFRMASLRRLGLIDVPEGATCAIPPTTSGGAEEEVCGHLLDRHFTHPQLCGKGPAKLRAHTALASSLARQLRDCRADVDMERVVPELMQEHRQGNRAEYLEAILDIVATWPGQVRPAWIDVTVRCPHAERYPVAHSRPGHAAAVAEQSKLERYGPGVFPVAFETYGRIGDRSRESLQVLALLAGAYVGDQWALLRLVPQWTAQLQRAVLFAVADVDLLALGARVGSIAIAMRRACDAAGGVAHVQTG